MRQSGEFNLQALFAALDAQRKARGLSWAQATQEMTGQPGRSSGHRLSPSTVTRTRTGAVAEGDGVLQMLRWLDRTPESFVPGHDGFEDATARLPDIPPGYVLRFDTRRLYAALDAQRLERKMTWVQVAKEVHLSAAQLTHLSKGGRTMFPHVMRIFRWLGCPAAHFTRASER